MATSGVWRYYRCTFASWLPCHSFEQIFSLMTSLHVGVLGARTAYVDCLKSFSGFGGFDPRGSLLPLAPGPSAAAF